MGGWFFATRQLGKHDSADPPVGDAALGKQRIRVDLPLVFRQGFAIFIDSYQGEAIRHDAEMLRLRAKPEMPAKFGHLSFR